MSTLFLILLCQCDVTVITSNDIHSYTPSVGFLPSSFSLVAFHWCGITYHIIISVALASQLHEQLGLTCLLLITWLDSHCSFWGYILKALLSSHWGTVTSMILGFGIRIWIFFKSPIPWWTMEVYGAIQVLPGSPCSTQLWIFAYKG